MGPDESWRVIEEHRSAIADLLEALPEQDWEQASLCAGWRVRDVAAHLVLGTTAPSLRTLVREAVRARGSFDRLNHDLAVRHGERPTEQIVSDLRQRAASRELPPMTNHRNMLFDVLVHGQDIALPLGRALTFPPAAGVAAVAHLWTLGWPFWTQRRFRGLSFRATDAGWSAGAGPEVRGPVRDVLLALAGRPVALAGLTGPGVDELSSRVAGTSRLIRPRPRVDG